MRWRCENPKDKDYKNYGARGISVCTAWQEFLPFYEWAMANGYEDDLTIDRENNNGNYEPGNCRFVTKKVNGRNRRANVFLTVNGRCACETEWCEILGCSKYRVKNWVRRYGIKEAEARIGLTLIHDTKGENHD
jgi:hypothetical protein